MYNLLEWLICINYTLEHDTVPNVNLSYMLGGLHAFSFTIFIYSSAVFI
jgi:hypothetical protein